MSRFLNVIDSERSNELCIDFTLCIELRCLLNMNLSNKRVNFYHLIFFSEYIVYCIYLCIYIN